MPSSARAVLEWLWFIGAAQVGADMSILQRGRLLKRRYLLLTDDCPNNKQWLAMVSADNWTMWWVKSQVKLVLDVDI